MAPILDTFSPWSLCSLLDELPMVSERAASRGIETDLPAQSGCQGKRGDPQELGSEAGPSIHFFGASKPPGLPWLLGLESLTPKAWEGARGKCTVNTNLDASQDQKSLGNISIHSLPGPGQGKGT